MARKVFFSFHYGRDLWRVNVVRNSGAIEGFATAGFHNPSLWDATKSEGGDALQRLINDGLEGTSVTVVLIGAETASRPWISYEIEQSIMRKNGIFGVRINFIKDQNGMTDTPGPVPVALTKIGAPVYDWEYGRLGEWVEMAHKKANPK